MRLHVLLFWFHDDWGRYGRAYEMVAAALAARPDVARVACVFPPAPRRRRREPPLEVRRPAPKLFVVKERGRAEKGGALSRGMLRAWLVLHGFRPANTLLWIFPPHPYAEVLAASIPHRGLVAQVVDNFLEFHRDFWLYDHARRQYPRLPLLADLIVTSSRANHRRFGGRGTPCRLMENGVDPRFLSEPTPLPWRRRGGRPRLGYVGWITDRTDVDLLAAVARRRPDWDLVLAGPEYRGGLSESGLLACANVTYRGAVPYAEVPALLRDLDVCLLAHRDTPYSRSMSPLKLLQYLASGRPVVSTDVAGVERFRSLVTVARGPDAFVRGIEAALAEEGTDAAARRIAAASGETWDRRLAAIFPAVREVMTAPPSAAGRGVVPCPE